MKKLVCFVLCLVMCLSLLTGCADFSLKDLFPADWAVAFVTTRESSAADTLLSESAALSGSSSAPESASSGSASSEASPETPSEAPAEESSSGSAQAGPEEPEDAGEPLTLTLSEETAVLGEVVTLRVTGADETPTASVGLSHQPVFLPDGEAYLALLPIHVNSTLGEYPVTVSSGGKSASATLTVADREFETQHMTIDEDVADSTVNSDAANYEWNLAIEPLKEISTPEKYWEGLFQIPVKEGNYTITSEYALKRYTNDDPTPTRHMGVDFAAGTGTPVYAANHGVILYADFLQLTGYTIVLDHGYGLKSFHYHLDSLECAAGDVVQKGDLIGRVGTTGYSTGPHLHYALTVNRVFVNPWTAFQEGIGEELFAAG